MSDPYRVRFGRNKLMADGFGLYGNGSVTLRERTIDVRGMKRWSMGRRVLLWVFLPPFLIVLFEKAFSVHFGPLILLGFYLTVFAIDFFFGLYETSFTVAKSNISQVFWSAGRVVIQCQLEPERGARKRWVQIAFKPSSLDEGLTLKSQIEARP